MQSSTSYHLSAGETMDMLIGSDQKFSQKNATQKIKIIESKFIIREKKRGK